MALAVALALGLASPGLSIDRVGDADDAEGAAAPDAQSVPESFGELLAGFAEMSGLEARFEEEKFLALLAAPLRSSGRLYFAPPSTLLRRVETPSRQNILIRANVVRISDGDPEGEGGDVQMIDLSARAGIRPLIESMIWIFTGDRASLERVYDVDFQRDPDAEQGNRWQVRLTPKEAPLSDLIQELRVAGRGRGADTMELVETSGDRTLTHIFDADAQRVFSPAERLELFGAVDR